MKRLLLLSTLVVAGLASVVWSQSVQSPAPPAPDPANFTGAVTNHAISDIRTLRYSFEPGARTNWHRHEGGQVVLVERGRARVQEAGGPLREVGPRQTFVTEPGIVHWHGAVPGEPLTQVALSFGATTWLDRVTDAQYAGTAGR